MKKTIKKTFNKRFFLSLLLSFTLTGITLGGSWAIFSKTYAYVLGIVEEDNERKNIENLKEMTVTISETTTLESLAEELFNNHFIGSKEWFVQQGKLSEIVFEPGTYTLTNNMSNDAILNSLVKVENAEEDTVKFTIPEGFTLLQIANRLDDLEIVSQKDFLKAATEKNYSFSFLQNVPASVKYKLEGYLFPDTYIVRKDASAEEIILKMLNRFEEIYTEYTQSLYASSYSLHEVLTIASIIEQEAKLEEERPMISGVIYNRLDAKMKLQMCSTVQYLLDKRQANLSLEDLEIDSPYNTYLYEGLPLGPICSPGRQSLEAALMPEANNYYYFVLQNATSGKHAFSATANEHAQNKVAYNQTTDKNFLED